MRSGHGGRRDFRGEPWHYFSDVRHLASPEPDAEPLPVSVGKKLVCLAQLWYRNPPFRCSGKAGFPFPRTLPPQRGFSYPVPSWLFSVRIPTYYGLPMGGGIGGRGISMRSSPASSAIARAFPVGTTPSCSRFALKTDDARRYVCSVPFRGGSCVVVSIVHCFLLTSE